MNGRKYNSNWVQIFPWSKKTPDDGTEICYCKFCHCTIFLKVNSVERRKNRKYLRLRLHQLLCKTEPCKVSRKEELTVQSQKFIPWITCHCAIRAVDRRVVLVTSSFEPVLSIHCLAALDVGESVEQPFNCLIIQNRQAVLSMNWAFEDRMVAGLFFCAALTGSNWRLPWKQLGTFAFEKELVLMNDSLLRQ